jgi:hypothetical protein
VCVGVHYLGTHNLYIQYGEHLVIAEASSLFAKLQSYKLCCIAAATRSRSKLDRALAPTAPVSADFGSDTYVYQTGNKQAKKTIYELIYNLGQL